MVILHSYVNVYQRVVPTFPHSTLPPLQHHQGTGVSAWSHVGPGGVPGGAPASQAPGVGVEPGASNVPFGVALGVLVGAEKLRPPMPGVLQGFRYCFILDLEATARK